VDANAALLLHFMMMLQTLPPAVQVGPIIFLEVSNQTPILFYSFSTHIKCFYNLNWGLLLTLLYLFDLILFQTGESRSFHLNLWQPFLYEHCQNFCCYSNPLFLPYPWI